MWSYFLPLYTIIRFFSFLHMCYTNCVWWVNNCCVYILYVSTVNTDCIPMADTSIPCTHLATQTRALWNGNTWSMWYWSRLMYDGSDWLYVSDHHNPASLLCYCCSFVQLYVACSAGICLYWWPVRLTALSGHWPARLPGGVKEGSSATVTSAVHGLMLSDHPHSLRSQLFLALSHPQLWGHSKTFCVCPSI